MNKRLMMGSTILMLLIVTACTRQVQSPNTLQLSINTTLTNETTHPANATQATNNSSSNEPFNTTALDELYRLNNLNSLGYLNQSDFSRLEMLFANDSYASKEIAEIKVLSKYKEYEHVFHGLSFLIDYVTTGYPELCPGHSLSHYYVYMKHNETGYAADNLVDAENNLQIWIPLAEASNAQYNFTTDFNATVERIKNDIASIDSGNTTATDDEIEWLATVGSICVEDKRVR